MAVPNTTSSGVVFLPRHDVHDRLVLNWTGIFCTKSAEEPGLDDQDQRNPHAQRGTVLSDGFAAPPQPTKLLLSRFDFGRAPCSTPR
jgi:hypothetical protein